MSDLITLKCPNCASVIKTEAVDPYEGVARCSYCKAITTLPAFMRKERVRPRPPMPAPPGVRLQNEAGRLVITRRWFSWAGIGFSTVGVLALVLFWLPVPSSGAMQADDSWPVVATVFSFVAGYMLLAALFNRTWIKAQDGVLSLIHGPLPWPGNQVIPCTEVDQLFCKEVIQHKKDGPEVSYELWAATTGGVTRRLLKSFPGEDQALFFEQQIEMALGIDDRPMPGEVVRR
jgi:hypothetical protein